MASDGEPPARTPGGGVKCGAVCDWADVVAGIAGAVGGVVRATCAGGGGGGGAWPCGTLGIVGLASVDSAGGASWPRPFVVCLNGGLAAVEVAVGVVAAAVFDDGLCAAVAATADGLILAGGGGAMLASWLPACSWSLLYLALVRSATRPCTSLSRSMVLVAPVGALGTDARLG